MIYASKLMDCGDLDRSLTIYQMIIEKVGKVKVLAFEAKCEAASILLLQGKVDQAKALLDKQDMMQVKAYAKSMSSKQRLLFLYSLKADGDPAKPREIYEQSIKNRHNYTLRGKVEMDLDLIVESRNAYK